MPFLTQGPTNWKFIAIVAVLAIISAIIILSYCQLTIKELEAPSPEIIRIPEKVTEDEFADWLTYRNEEYGFEIRYPQDGSLYKEAKKINFSSSSIYFETGDVVMTVHNFLEIEEGARCSVWQEKKEKLKIGEIDFWKTAFTDQATGTNYNIINYQPLNKEFCFSFVFAFPAHGLGMYYVEIPEGYEQEYSQWLEKERRQFEKVAEQIISTSSFFETKASEEILDEVVGWQTYKNKEYRFEMSFPDNWDYSVRADDLFSFSGNGVDFLVFINRFDGVTPPIPSGPLCQSEEFFSFLGEDSFNKRIISIFQEGVSEGECEKFLLDEHLVYSQFCINEELKLYHPVMKEAPIVGYSISCDGGNLYDIMLVCQGEYWQEKEGKNKCGGLFDQILSTFSFIEATGDFCGWSTYGECSSDADCSEGGCSGQVCESKNEEPTITTCEWMDCYDSKAYGVRCKCIEGKCQWVR